jgi:hypothetical protein
MEITMTIPAERYDDSIQETLARETARRKRVFLAFIVLLLVPIAIGAFALTKAPSETAKVANDVTPIVTERVGGQITERVTSDVVSRAEPIIRDNVARAITANVEPRIASAADALRKDITDLQTTTRETAQFVAAATPQLSAITGFEDRLLSLDGSLDQTRGLFQTLKNDQEGLRRDVATDRQFSRGLSSDIDRANTRLTNEIASSRQQLSSQIVSFREQVDALRQATARDLASIRTLANTSVQTANSNKEAIGALSRRVSAVEADVRRLQERVKALEDARVQLR